MSEQQAEFQGWAKVERRAMNNLAPLSFTPIIQMVLDSVTSPQSKRAYSKALSDFMGWYQDTKPEGGFCKATVQEYRALLLDAEGISLGKFPESSFEKSRHRARIAPLAAASINVRLTAIRKLAREAGDNGLLAPAIALGISHVPNVKNDGVRTGNWLTLQQAERLLGTPDAETLRGKRDRALLSVLIGCGLRREEASNLKLEHIQMRDARWVIVDLRGKGNRVRSVPMPAWCKAAIDDWTLAGFLILRREGYDVVTLPGDHDEACTRNLFSPVNKADQHLGGRMSPQSIFMIVKRLAKEAGLGSISPHDLRRTFAKLAHKGRAQLEQIQLSLGHASIQTTERYLGVRQDFEDAPCDHLGISGIK